MTKQTISNAALSAIVAAVLADPKLAQLVQRSAVKSGPKAAAKHVVKPKASPSWDVEAATVAAFKKAGFEDVQPRINVLTHKGWEAKGFRVKKGQKAVFVKKPGKAGKGLPLFHQGQVEAITA